MVSGLSYTINEAQQTSLEKLQRKVLQNVLNLNSQWFRFLCRVSRDRKAILINMLNGKSERQLSRF